MADISYAGAELDLFAEATTWKRYFRGHLAPYLGEQVLEVGAGKGSTAMALCSGAEKRWVCLEPDAELVEVLQHKLRIGELPACCQAVEGTLQQLPEEPRFDTILYIDVLEHIEHDAPELARAAGLLAPGGHVLVLAPAHAWLYTEFDQAIGHFRRYDRRSLAGLTPETLELVRLIYLDSVGLLASLGNRVLLRNSLPTRSQIALWDRLLVPTSRWLDPLLRYSAGKSILGVWRRRPPG